MYLFFSRFWGLTFTQIAILEAIYNLTTLVGEIPTGYIGDRVGRRNSLLVGTTLISFTLVGIGLSSSFQALAVLYVCWSAGYNFRSGSEDAWLYDTLTDAAPRTHSRTSVGGESPSHWQSAPRRLSPEGISEASTSRIRGSSLPR